MEMSAKKQLFPRRVLELSVDALRPNPNQPRVEFDEDSLRALSDSIRRYGILQPLTVRRTDEGYELIAGERRLRAAKLAGLREVPCLLARSSEEESALLALVENLQRRDLHYLEEAAAIARLISSYGLSQEQAAEKLGKSNCVCCACHRIARACCARMTFPSGTPGRCCALPMRRIACMPCRPLSAAAAMLPRAKRSSRKC